MSLDIIGLTGSLVNLTTGRGPNLTELIHNPFNPYRDALKRADPIMTYTWYIEMPGYDFGASAGEGLLGGAISNVANSLSGAANGIASQLGGVTQNLVQQGINGLTSNLASSASSLIGNITGLDYSYIEEASLPMRQFSARRIFRNGTWQKSYENYSIGDMRLQVYADSDGKSLRYLNAWHNSPMVQASSRNRDVQNGIWRATGKVKRPITAVILAPNHKKVAYVEYVGCWITDFSEINLNSNGSERLVYSVNISVDDVFITVTGMEGLIDAGASLMGWPL